MALPSSEPPRDSPKTPGQGFPPVPKEPPLCCIPQLLKFFPAPFASLHSLFGSIPTIQERKPSLSSLVGLGLWGWEGFAATKARTGEVQGNAAPGGKFLFSKTSILLGAASMAPPAPEAGVTPASPEAHLGVGVGTEQP